jgi:hypothetical protein
MVHHKDTFIELLWPLNTIADTREVKTFRYLTKYVTTLCTVLGLLLSSGILYSDPYYACQNVCIMLFQCSLYRLVDDLLPHSTYRADVTDL